MSIRCLRWCGNQPERNSCSLKHFTILSSCSLLCVFREMDGSWLQTGPGTHLLWKVDCCSLAVTCQLSRRGASSLLRSCRLYWHSSATHQGCLLQQHRSLPDGRSPSALISVFLPVYTLRTLTTLLTSLPSVTHVLKLHHQLTFWKKEGRQKVVWEIGGLASAEALCGWETLCTPRLSHLEAGRCFAYPRQRVSPPSGHLRRSLLPLASSLCWMDFTHCREEGQDSSSFSHNWKKKSNCHHFLKSLIAFPLPEGFL